MRVTGNGMLGLMHQVLEEVENMKSMEVVNLFEDKGKSQ